MKISLKDTSNKYVEFEAKSYNIESSKFAICSL